jgi:hypothetical protein
MPHNGVTVGVRQNLPSCATIPPRTRFNAGNLSLSNISRLLYLSGRNENDVGGGGTSPPLLSSSEYRSDAHTATVAAHVTDHAGVSGAQGQRTNRRFGGAK